MRYCPRPALPGSGSLRPAPARAAAAGWHHGSGLRAALRPVVFGSVGVLILLASFGHVVQQAVVNGALRHQADARHADASWRCRALPGAGSSARCLSALGPVR